MVENRPDRYLIIEPQRNESGIVESKTLAEVKYIGEARKIKAKATHALAFIWDRDTREEVF